MSEIRRAIPSHLFVRSTERAVGFLIRDICMAAIVWYFAMQIEPLEQYVHKKTQESVIFVPWISKALACALWLT